MVELKENLERVKRDFVDNCVGCGVCVEACPYFPLGKLDGFDPMEISEKRLALLKDHIFSDEAYIYSRGCLLCGACESACPVGLNPYLINIISRTELAHWDGAVSERYSKDTANLRYLLPNHKYNIFKVLYSLQIRSEEIRWISAVPENPRPADAVLFLSCQTLAHADRMFTTMEILQKLNIDFVALAGIDFCCGFLNVLAGDTDGAEVYINQLADAVRAFDARTFLVGCTTCYGWLRDLSDLEALPFKFQHTTQCIADNIGSLDIKGSMNREVTFHDACHFGRLPDEYEAPRRIVQAIPGITLHEMEHNREHTVCCGSPASGFQPDVAKKIRARRLAEASRAKVDLLLTACDGCEFFLRSGADGHRFQIGALERLLGEATGIMHRDRLRELYSCESVNEVLEMARGCIWEDIFHENEIRGIISSVFGIPDA